MRLPPILHVSLGPSRIAGAAIGTMTLATLVVVLQFPIAPWQHAVICAIVQLRLAPDLLIVVTRGDGRLVGGHVRSSTCVSAAMTSIVWRPDGARWSRAILVVPDMLPADEFRRLRVMLRYARSGRTQDAPANQS